MARNSEYTYGNHPSSAAGSEAITLSNDLVHKGVVGFIVGTGGDLKVTMVDGSTAIWPSLIAGVQYSGQIKKFHTTDSTAANIIVLY